MANHKSAIKRHKQSLKKRLRNRIVKSAARTAMKEFRKEIESNIEGAQAKLVTAEKRLQSAASKGILNKKTVARTVSRLAKSLKEAQAAE